MKKAVVTGANGFVGSNLIKELLNHGYMVYAVVRSRDSNMDRIPQSRKIQAIFCDLKDMGSLPELLHGEKAGLFFHFGWEGTAGDARGDYKLQLHNAKYACDAVSAAAKLGCKRFVFAGSIMEYEAKAYLSQRNIKAGRGYFYSAAKLAAGYMVKVQAFEEGIEYIHCVISNIYGIGEMSGRFIDKTIRKMLNKEKLLFTPGEQYYDFIYISDAVKAICIASEKGMPGSEYYIGCGKPRKLKEYIEAMRDIVEPAAEMHFGALDYNGPFLDYREIETDRLVKEFGFQPEVSFELGIQMTKEWIEEKERWD